MRGKFLAPFHSEFAFVLPLAGSFPPELGDLNALEELHLGDHDLSGEFRFGICVEKHFQSIPGSAFLDLASCLRSGAVET